MKPSRSESPKYNFVNHGKIVKTLNFLYEDVCMVNNFISEQKLMRFFCVKSLIVSYLYFSIFVIEN